MKTNDKVNFASDRDIIAIKYLVKRQNTKALRKINFTQELIERKDMSGDCLLHILAEEGYIHLVPKELITHKSLELLDKDQNSVLHIIALKSQLNQVSSNLLTNEKLLKKNSEGNTALHFGAMGGDLTQFPKDFLNLENLLISNKAKQTSLHLAIYFKKTNCIPKEFLNQATVNICDSSGDTLLHTAAASNSLKNIPKSLMTIENISKTNNKGETIAHTAVKSLCLNDIPKECLTTEIMGKKSSDGSTPLHLGCQQLDAYSLCQFTPKQLSIQSLTTPDNKGLAPIDTISKGNLHLLPTTVLTKDLLLWVNPKNRNHIKTGETPLQSFCNTYHAQQHGTLNYICSLLDTKILKAMKIEDDEAKTTIHWHIMKKSLKSMARDEGTINL